MCVCVFVHYIIEKKIVKGKMRKEKLKRKAEKGSLEESTAAKRVGDSLSHFRSLALFYYCLPLTSSSFATEQTYLISKDSHSHSLLLLINQHAQ